MAPKKRQHADELRGLSRLATEATKAVSTVVEDMHRTIASGPAVLGKPLEGPAHHVLGLIYGSIRGATDLVGASIEIVLSQLGPLLGHSDPGPERDAVLAALNGVLGDRLDSTGNALAIEMQLRHAGRRLDLQDPQHFVRSLPGESRRLLLLVHGSSMNDRQWLRKGHDHGRALCRDLGYAPLYLFYNTGRHISTNGKALAELLEALASAWPVPIDEIVILAHSMGGLVTRSACRAAEVAGLSWRSKLRKLVFLGTPHHGAPLEKAGNWMDVLLEISRYSAPLAQLGKGRSEGITDLRFGYVLDEHWRGRDRFEPGVDTRTPVPLPENVACYALAGQLPNGPLSALRGDGLVPVRSALGIHERADLHLAFPQSHTATMAGVGHLDLLSDPGVYEICRGWLQDTPSGA